MSDGSVWLVGMMGAGKSAVGPLLAARLGRPFLDADVEIADRAGRPIAGIFALEGEAGFRTRERAWIEETAGQPVVVALGGGAVAQPGIAARCAGSGTVVWLRARPETLLARIGATETRPLLAGLSASERLERLEKLLAERAAHYESASLVVDVDTATPDEIAETIATRLLAPAVGVEGVR